MEQNDFFSVFVECRLEIALLNVISKRILDGNKIVPKYIMLGFSCVEKALTLAVMRKF